MAVIKRVIIKEPLPENYEEYSRRAAKATAKVLSEILPPEVFCEFIKRIEKKLSE